MLHRLQHAVQLPSRHTVSAAATSTCTDGLIETASGQMPAPSCPVSTKAVFEQVTLRS